LRKNRSPLMKKALFFSTIVLLVGTSVGLAQDRFSLSSDRVAIYNLAGEVRVEPGTSSSVVIEVTRGGSNAGDLRVERINDGSWQQLVVKYPADRVVYRRLGRLSRSEFGVRDDGTFGTRNLDPQLGAERANANVSDKRGGSRVRVSGSGSGLEAYADMRIEVPRGRTVAIHLGVGKVIATNVNGDLQIDARSASIEATNHTGFARFDTGSGSITLRGAAGDVGLHTGSGSIHAEGVRRGVLVAHTGSGSVDVANLDVSEMEINTGSGSVTVRSAEAPAARIETGSGGIRADQLGASNFDLNTGSGSVRVSLTRDVQTGRIETGSGGVNVALPRDAGAEITIDTGSGGIDMDASGFTVTESRRSYLRGRLGDGSGSLRVSTGSGGVSFRSL
jgi:lia operon protein LiaG